MSKHTPGPWEISDTVHIDGNGTYRRIQQPHFGGDIVGLVCVAHLANSDLNGSGPANARLIAAGPELLQALQDALQYLQHHLPDEALVPHRAAIAKATGEAA